jgi:phage terminase large subunit-like protein
MNITTDNVDEFLKTLDIALLTYDEKLELNDLLEVMARRAMENLLAKYRPYAKQKMFHDAGALADITERLLRAGNQVGKTWSAGFETAMHLTGRYPDWWDGKRFDHPTVGWALGVTGESTRDNPQRILLGRSNPEEGETMWGTGAIPAECIIHITRKSHGVANAVDTVAVRHISGGVSIVSFKSYEQGREKLQGETLDFAWCDEEPDEGVYSEIKTRVQAGDEGRGGIVYITFTPLLGMSNVVKRFLVDHAPGTHDTNMTIEDAEHYSPERRAAIIAGYPAHERDARAQGIPILGSGRVFPIEQKLISIPAFRLPAHWPRIAACDFGWNHPAGGAWIAWDRETDTAYVYDCYKQREQLPRYHAEYFKAKGEWIPVAWPHDGLDKRKTGEATKDEYKRYGANMLDSHATNAEGSNSLEVSVGDVLDRMQTGRLKIFDHLTDLFDEINLYHRDDGIIVDVNDDIISAMRYGLMSLRFAITPSPPPRNIPVFASLDPEAGY